MRLEVSARRAAIGAVAGMAVLVPRLAIAQVSLPSPPPVPSTGEVGQTVRRTVTSVETTANQTVTTAEGTVNGVVSDVTGGNGGGGNDPGSTGPNNPSHPSTGGGQTPGSSPAGTPPSIGVPASSAASAPHPASGAPAAHAPVAHGTPAAATPAAGRASAARASGERHQVPATTTPPPRGFFGTVAAMPWSFFAACIGLAILGFLMAGRSALPRANDEAPQVAAGRASPGRRRAPGGAPADRPGSAWPSSDLCGLPARGGPGGRRRLPRRRRDRRESHGDHRRRRVRPRARCAHRDRARPLHGSRVPRDRDGAARRAPSRRPRARRQARRALCDRRRRGLRLVAGHPCLLERGPPGTAPSRRGPRPRSRDRQRAADRGRRRRPAGGETRVALKPGTRICFVTDGLLEARDSHGRAGRTRAPHASILGDLPADAGAGQAPRRTPAARPRWRTT